MAKELKPLIITAPTQGIAQSPHVGFGNMRNLDIYSVPGVARLNHIMVKESDSSGEHEVTRVVNWIVKNFASPSNLYALDALGVVYTSDDSGASWTLLSDRGGVGNGLVVWKDYLLVFESTAIDTYGPLSGTPAWSDGWQTVDSDTWHPAIVSKLDGNVYFGAGRYVGSIAEVSGQNFAPGTGATFTFTQQHLDLPEDYKVKCLAEQNNNLMIGTWQGSNIYENKIADIFPWDGSSTSYNKPIILNENGINALININEWLYILAGTEGKIFKSNGSQAWQIAQIPISSVDILENKRIQFYPGSIAHHKGKLVFGISSGNLNVEGMGIFSLLETDKGNILNFEHFISTENTSNANGLGVTALLSISNNQLAAGWYDGTTEGIDLTSTTSYAYTTDYSGYFESPLVQIGTHLNPRQFSILEFTLAKELAASEGIRVKFRYNLTDTWTTQGTYTSTDIGAGESSFATSDIKIKAAKQIQIRVELLGTATTTPEFKQLTLM